MSRKNILHKTLYAGLLLTIIVSGVSAQSNTGPSQDNNAANFSFVQDNINKTFSVGTSSNLDIELNSTLNESQSVALSSEGNISQFVYSIQSPVSTIPEQPVSVLNQIVVDRDQHFGTYTGNVTATYNNSTRKLPVSIEVVDNISPEFNDVQVNDLMALTGEEFTVDVRDNLNVSNVSGTIYREVEQQSGNTTETVNETFINETRFNNVKGREGVYSLQFNDSDSEGRYWINITATDTSNNSISTVEGFNVDRLDSVNLLEENFVFDTIRPKEETTIDLIKNSIDGKEFTIGLDNLSYGGNATVRIGIIPPNEESPEILGSGETQSFEAEGVYQVMLLHSGNNEEKGTHRVTGDLSLVRPAQHVRPVNSSIVFSGTVKNVDKPPETCTRVEEFDSCIAYSFDQASSMFSEEFGSLENGTGESRVYMVSSLPTREVEGSDSWGETTSLTMGEYNKTIDRNQQLNAELEEARSKAGTRAALILWMLVLMPGIGGLSLFYYREYGQYVSFVQTKEKLVEKANVKEPPTGVK